MLVRRWVSKPGAARRRFLVGASGFVITAVASRAASVLEPRPVEPLRIDFKQIADLVGNLLKLANTLTKDDEARLAELLLRVEETSAKEIEAILDEYTLIRSRLGHDGVGVCTQGAATPELNELGWRTYLVRVENPARLVGPLALVSRQALPEGDLQTEIHEARIFGNDTPGLQRSNPDLESDYEFGPDRWLGFRFAIGAQPWAGLAGLPLEYQPLQVYSQSGGSNRASISICAASVDPGGRGHSLGFSTEYRSVPASTVALDIRETNGIGTVASLVIRDSEGRLYPAPAHRLEPDLGYQPNIYRANGETLRLPVGNYTILVQRGPEYRASEHLLLVPPGGQRTALEVTVARWVDPPSQGWYPGDPHIHPDGQSFGAVSKLGLTPETLLRQIRGESLSVGSVLIWTGGYYYEKPFLTGHVYDPTGALPFPEMHRANNSSFEPERSPQTSGGEGNLLRYDVEQAAFPSNRLGHPMLLRLRGHDFPGARSIYDWPSWNLPILKWARRQGAIVGYAHCGHGMGVDSTALPNFEIPPLDGLGANECLVDITHGVVDFVAGGEAPPAADLNVWYHLLNCGFVIPMIGETDFPAGAGTKRVGTVRTYVGLDEWSGGDAAFDAWTANLKAGRLYFGDGRSHIMDFSITARRVGSGPLELDKPGCVRIRARVAAWLSVVPGNPDKDYEALGYASWHLERARLGLSRSVLLEVIVNGQVRASEEVQADGVLREIEIPLEVRQSSWIALRILPSVHTAPFLVSVSGRPVRASKRSAEWCLECLEVLWKKHAFRIREPERVAAAAAWNHARSVYRQIRAECIESLR